MLFAQEVFGLTLDPWQVDALRAYGRGERGISIKACHGPGKTLMAAVMVWHMLLTKFPQKTVATAPSKGQLEDALVATIMGLFGQLTPALRELFVVKKNRIELKAAPDESFFSARTARAENPEALQGVHSDNVLLIADEASGVPEQIFKAAVGSMSGHHATTLLLSNPVRTSGLFFDTHMKPGVREKWHRITISAFDSTRVSAAFVQEVADRYGETSNEYRIRVLGEFPSSDTDTIIPFDLVYSAKQRDIVVPRALPEVWGVDVARFGDDANSLVRRNSIGVLPDILKWEGRDLMQSAGKIKRLYDDTATENRPTAIYVDVIGLGAGVVDRLRELNLPVVGVNVSEASSDPEKYLNLRAELWFLAREWFATLDHTLPSCVGGCDKECLHEQLVSELLIPRYQYTSSGRIQAEPKEAIKKRGHKSPNIADAFVLTMAATPAVLMRGRGANAHVGWNQPVSRGLAVV